MSAPSADRCFSKARSVRAFRFGREAFRPPHPVPASSKPPHPRCHKAALSRAIAGERKTDCITIRRPFRDDGDAVAELDKAFRICLSIIMDRDSASPKGMAMRKLETHLSEIPLSHGRDTMFGVSTLGLRRSNHKGRNLAENEEPLLPQGTHRSRSCVNCGHFIVHS